MDFHKLQQTLNDIEPSDPRQDIERLKQAAQGNNSPEPRQQQVTESSVPSKPAAPSRELNESEQMAALAGITPSSAQPSSDPSEVNEMAALAGIQLDERQKKGRAGQARGSDSMPKKSKPSKSGEQKHPLKDKLVGSSTGYEEKDVDDVEEGAVGDIWKHTKNQYKTARKDSNYNNLGAFKGNLSGSKGSSSGSGKKAKSTTTSEGSGLSPKLSKALAPYETALTNVLKDPRQKDLFKRLMAQGDPSLKKESVYESKQVSDRASSIKEDLLRRLNSKK